MLPPAGCRCNPNVASFLDHIDLASYALLRVSH